MTKNASSLVEEFLATVESSATRRAYRSDLKSWLELLNSSDLLVITDDDLAAATRKESFRRLAASTQKRCVAVLKSYRRWAASRDGTHVPTLKVATGVGNLISGRPSTEAELLSRQQCRVLLKVARQAGNDNGVRNHAMIFFMLSVPMRRSAMSRIDVEDLYLDGQLPYVDCAHTRGGLPLRYVLPIDTIRVLEAHKEHYGIASGPLWRSHSRRNPGGRLTPTSIYRIVRETAMKAGLPDIGAHTLRHTGCILAIDNGASLQQVQTHARHKQIETTMVYVHQRDRLRDSAADFIKIDEQDDA